MNTVLTAEHHVDQIKEISKASLSLSQTKNEIAACIGTVSLDMQREIAQIMDSQNPGHNTWPYIKSYIQGNIENGGIALDPMRDTNLPWSTISMPTIQGASSDTIANNNTQPSNTTIATQATRAAQTEPQSFIEKIKALYTNRITDSSNKTDKPPVNTTTSWTVSNRFDTTGNRQSNESNTMTNNTHESQEKVKWNNPYRLYHIDERAWDYNTLISNNQIFDPNVYKNADFRTMQNEYEKDIKNRLSIEDYNRVKKLSNEIIQKNNNNKIKSDTFVTIPMYVKETDTDKLIEQLLLQEWEFTICIYVNWPRLNKGQATGIDENTIVSKVQDTEKIFVEKIDELRQNGKLKGEKKLITFWNLYEERASLWTIRADSFDSLALAIDPSIKQPIQVWIDADVYNIEKWYIKSVRDTFDNREKSWKHLSMLSAQRRWSKPTPGNKFVWLSEMLYIMWEENTKNRAQYGWWIPNWRTTSNDMTDLLKVKWWYPRGIHLWDDIIHGNKILNFYGGGNGKDISVTWINRKKIYSDNRRCLEVLSTWKMINEQRTPDFQFVDKDKIDIDNEYMRYNENITNKMMSKQILNETELQDFSNNINRYCNYFTNLEWKNYNDIAMNERFCKFWNISIGGNSLYKSEVNWSGIRFIKK